MWKYLLFSFLACVLTDEVPKSKIVKISQGKVQGYLQPSGVFVFYSIPYATAPTGRNRYKAPLPPPSWLGIFPAINRKIACPQYTDIKYKEFNYMVDRLVMEDCLVANIYVPDTNQTNLPVIVSIHGGAFGIGYNEMNTATILVKNKNIILVNFNYRIGTSGFLCLGTEDIPGNAGMKDQVALLRWVKLNIAAFGGNADDVTITGCSSGSHAVDLLMLSKTTDGLFAKIISESGYGLGSLSIVQNPLDNAKAFAKHKGFTDVDNFYALEEFYKSTSWSNLTAFPYMGPDATLTFAPCVERDTGSGEAFLDEAPYDILKQGSYKKLPILYGIANAEGVLQLPYFDRNRVMMNENFASVLPADLKFKSEAQKKAVAAKIRKKYFGDKPVDINNIMSYIEYYSDIFYVTALGQIVKLHHAAGHRQMYLNEFSFVDEGFPPLIPHNYIKKELGAGHCQQSLAVFDGLFLRSQNEDILPDKVKQIKALMRDLWHNFATTSTPAPEGSRLWPWPPVGADLSPHMSLNVTQELRGPLYKDRIEFWEEIYDKYYQPPTPPPPPPPRRTEL